MKFLGVHPGPLMYTKVFLRLEPLGLELVAASARAAGHEARLIDLQVEDHAAYHRLVAQYRPDVIAFSCNYLANVPEIVDLAKATKAALPQCFILVGGHSASFTAAAILEHGAGAIDCVLTGEGEAGVPLLLAALERGGDVAAVPGAVTAAGAGPPPGFVQDLDALRPARDLLRHRRKYFIGVLDPCASIEFSRGCPWDCAFCSAWTFYGRSYRLRKPGRDPRRARSHRRARHFHRRRCRLHPCRARPGDRRGHRAARHRQEILPRDPRRRAVAQQGGVPLLARHRAQIYFPRPRGDRRGGAAQVSQAHLARRQFRGPRIRALARHRRRHQPHRRSGLGRAPVRGGARMVHGRAGSGEHQRQHALSRHRDLAHRGAAHRDPRLSPLRHPALRAADAAAAGEILRGTGDDAARAGAKAFELAHAGRGRPHHDAAVAARPDQFRQEPVQVQQRLQSGAAAGGPRPAGRLRNPAAAGAASDGEARRAVRASPPRARPRCSTRRRSASSIRQPTPRSRRIGYCCAGVSRRAAGAAMPHCTARTISGETLRVPQSASIRSPSVQCSTIWPHGSAQ